MLYFETHDFRACLALPLDADHVYVGTTDIRTDDPDDRHYSEAEVEYIFKCFARSCQASNGAARMWCS